MSALIFRLSAFYLILSVTYNPVCWSHKGHDHGDDDQSHHSGHDMEDIVEKDHSWMSASKVPFSKGSGFDLRWKQNSSDKVLTMKMTAKTNGYVAVGFCPVWHGTMEGCDIVLGWVDNTNGSVYVHVRPIWDSYFIHYRHVRLCIIVYSSLRKLNDL